MCNAFFTSRLFSSCVPVSCYTVSKLKSLETRAKFPAESPMDSSLLSEDYCAQMTESSPAIAPVTYPVLIFSNGGFLQGKSNTAHQTSSDLRSDFLSKKWLKHEEGTCWSVCSEALKVNSVYFIRSIRSRCVNISVWLLRQSAFFQVLLTSSTHQFQTHWPPCLIVLLNQADYKYRLWESES